MSSRKRRIDAQRARRAAEASAYEQLAGPEIEPSELEGDVDRDEDEMIVLGYSTREEARAARLAARRERDEAPLIDRESGLGLLLEWWEL